MTAAASAADGRAHGRGPMWAIALSALGVVYGDIGTSPLYALRECFFGPHAIELTEASILGVLSMIVWALIIVVSIKYMAFVLRADNRGEGGILALAALAIPAKLREKRFVLLSMGLFGAALLYGDGVITPAISVLSAVEGLKLATPLFEPYVLPIACAILIGLFAFQKFGTAKIGLIFGPIILIWFTVLGGLGLNSLVQTPMVLLALDPREAYWFFQSHGMHGFLVLGAVFLVVTGGESLYADMGHFGKRPIRLAWFTIVLPGLLLNYFGQGALLLRDPSAAENPFYLLAPEWMLYPLVGLATVAAVIASQALISGVFSLTRQAIQLGFCPRLQIIHTSKREIGQIYLPFVNWALCLATILLVVGFKSSSNLAAAYGISVSSTMVITTFLLFFVAKEVWGWKVWQAVVVLGFLFLFDFAFFAANAVKISQGGWFPIMLATGIFILMTTWRKGRQILAERMRAASVPLLDFLRNVQAQNLVKVPGTALFMVGDPETTPPAMVHNCKHNHVIHNMVIVLTVLTKEIPHVRSKDRVFVEKIAPNFYRVIAHYGFIDSPNVKEIIDRCRAAGLDLNLDEITFFLGRETLIASDHPGMAIWREHVFAFLARNAQRATAFFHIPPNQVIEVGMQVEL